MDVLEVAIRHWPGAEDLPLPAYATRDSAGMDLRAAVGAPVALPAGAHRLFPTGIAVALPAGHEGQVRSRSGLAMAHGVFVLNSPGTIDADYRGEIGVILFNAGQATLTIERGMRIAQLLVVPVQRFAWSPVTSLPGTGRGDGGFGSTGVRPTGVRP